MTKDKDYTTKELMEHPPKILKYYDYDENEALKCPVCGWEGLPEGHIEYYGDLFDVSCPKCSNMLLVVSHPTQQEIKDAYHSGNKEAEADYHAVLAREEFDKECEEKKLKSPEQLPTIKGDELDFIWGFESADKFRNAETVLSCNGVELWRELAYYEGWRRFNVVKDILKQKYGTAFHALIPSKESRLFLYGDDLFAPRKTDTE